MMDRYKIEIYNTVFNKSYIMETKDEVGEWVKYEDVKASDVLIEMKTNHVKKLEETKNRYEAVFIRISKSLNILPMKIDVSIKDDKENHAEALARTIERRY